MGMTDPRIEAAAVIQEKPLHYNPDGTERLTDLLSKGSAKLAVDRITSNPTDIGYSFSVQLRYEQS